MRLRWGLFFIVPGVVAFAIGLLALAAWAQDSGNRGSTNLDGGLTDAERAAKYGDLRRLSIEQRAQVLTDFLASGRPVKDLPRVPALASYYPPAGGLSEAAASAPLIVRGRVLDQRLVRDEANPGRAQVVSTVAVASSAKGTVASQVEVEQSGWPTLMPDGSYALVVFESDPVLTVGDDVIVFAERVDDRNQRIVPEPFRTLRIVDGRVNANNLSIEMQKLDGSEVSEVARQVGLD